MTFQIRPIEAADRDRWQSLFEDYFVFYKVEVPENGFDTVWGWIFDPGNDFWCVVAEAEDGQVIGFLHYQLMHASLYAGMTLYMADLFVDPAWRGKGAARALIDHAFAFAREKGLPSVDWLTQETNYAGRRLYDTYQPRSEFVFYTVEL